MKKLMITALAVLLMPLFIKAQFTISGTVTENGKTLPGASVRLKNNSKGVATAANGKYQINDIKPGKHLVTVSFIGYQSIEKSIDIENDQILDFDLIPSAFLADEVVVRATRATEKSATTYKNLSKTDIEQNNFGQDLPFILSNTPGVVVTSDAGAGVGYTGIRIRGSDASRVNVTINGIPYNDSESQGIFWVNMPDFASSVDNIQIQRGVGISTNGGGAFGGSLNIQTSAPAQNAYAEVNNTYGSFNTLKNTVKVGTGLIDNKWSFDGRLSRITSDGFVDRAASKLKSYFLSGAYYGKTDLLRIHVFSGTEQTYQAWNGVPEAKLRGDLEGLKKHYENNLDYLYYTKADSLNLFNSNNRKYNQFTYRDQNDNYAQNHYQALYAKQFNEKFSFNGALHYTDGKGYYEEYKNKQKLSKYGLPPANVGGVAVTKTDLIRRRWLDNDFYGLTYALNYIPSSDLNITLGGAFNQYRGKHFGQVIWAQYASTSTNDYHYYDGKGNKDDFNTYAKVNYSPISELSLFGDVQYRNVNYDITGLDKNRNTLDFHNKYNFFNPKVGATYFINEKSNLYASFSVGNKEPNRDDFTNLKAELPVPKPEHLNNVELGYRMTNKTFNVGINAYGMFYKDQLIFTGQVNDGGDPYRQNVDKSSRIGIELDGSYTISPKFIVNANAALSRNKIKNYVDYVSVYDANYDPAGVQATNYANPDISFSPNTVLFGELVYKPLPKFAIALQEKYVSKQFMDNTQNDARKLNAYWLSNGRIGYDFSLKGIKNINIGLLANNMLNKKYESNGYTYSSIYPSGTVTENFYFPQAGTNFLLSLNLKF